MNEELNKNPDNSLKETSPKSNSVAFFDKVFLLRIINTLTILFLGVFILFWVSIFIFDGDYGRIVGVVLVGSLFYFFTKNKTNKLSIIRNVFIVSFLVTLIFIFISLAGM